MKKLLPLLLVCSTVIICGLESQSGEDLVHRMTVEQKQELFMNMLFGRHQAKEPGKKNDPSLEMMFHEKSKDVYWNFYCMLLKSEANAIIERACESAKFHVSRQYCSYFVAVKSTTPDYLLPSLSRPTYIEKALSVMRDEFKGSAGEHLGRIRGIELLYKVHKKLAIPAMQEEQFHALRFTVMQKAMRWEELSQSERYDIDVVMQWVKETDPIVLSKEIADEAVGVYAKEGDALLQKCIRGDAEAKTCCIQ